MEIERKWLLKSLPIMTNDCDEIIIIRQFYIGPARYRIRAVIFGDDQSSTTYQLTIKSDGTLSREEWEVEMPEWAFKVAENEHRGPEITKTIHLLKWGDIKLEFHEFKGHLNGLILLECEFPSEEKANSFVLPKSITNNYDAVEVTEDTRFQNNVLINEGFPIL